MDFDKEAGFDMPTEIRWQKAIYELCKKHLPNVDGSGCDSGDALDVTLSEIGQVIAHCLDIDCSYCEGTGSVPSETPDQLACGPESPCHVCKGTGDRHPIPASGGWVSGKVWVVEAGCYENTYIEDIFVSKEMAERRAAESDYGIVLDYDLVPLPAPLAEQGKRPTMAEALDSFNQESSFRAGAAWMRERGHEFFKARLHPSPYIQAVLDKFAALPLEPEEKQ